MKKSELEDTMQLLLRGIGNTDYVRNYRFDTPNTKREIDFAWPNKKIGIEIQGGIWNRGGHVRGLQYTRDRQKMNDLTLAGWRVLEFTTEDFKNQINMLSKIKLLIINI